MNADMREILEQLDEIRQALAAFQIIEKLPNGETCSITPLAFALPVPFLLAPDRIERATGRISCAVSRLLLNPEMRLLGELARLMSSELFTSAEAFARSRTDVYTNDILAQLSIDSPRSLGKWLASKTQPDAPYAEIEVTRIGTDRDGLIWKFRQRTSLEMQNEYWEPMRRARLVELGLVAHAE